MGAEGLEDVLRGQRGRDLHAQGARAVVRREQHTSVCHCKIGVQARGGVFEVCACASEAGWMARFIGSRGGVRAEGCSRGGLRARIGAKRLLHRRSPVAAAQEVVDADDAVLELGIPCWDR